MIVPATVAVGGGIGSGGAAFRAGANPAKPRGFVVAAEDTLLALLAGPVTPIGATAYDTMQLAQAAAFVGYDTETSQAYFYDGALAHYLLHARTNDAQWLARADALAISTATWASNPANHWAPDPAHPEGGALIGSPRDYSTLGMAIHYLRTGYANSRAGVRAQASGAYSFTPYGPFDPAYYPDSRESAYALMAMLATTLIGGDPNDYTAAMAAAVDSYITYQGQDQTVGGVQPNAGWQGWSQYVSGDGFYVSNYMSGLVVEALILYDRMIGDSRIVPAIKTWVDWLWSAQWVPLGGGPAQVPTSTTSFAIGTGSKAFTTQAGLAYNGTIVGQNVLIFSRADVANNLSGTVTAYSGTTLTINATMASGSGNHTDWDIYIIGYPGDQSADGIGCTQYETTFVGLTGGAILSVATQSHAEYVVLMGIILPALGYLYMKGQGAVYKTNGDTIVAALAQSTFPDVKMFNQFSRSAPKYFAWTA